MFHCLQTETPHHRQSQRICWCRLQLWIGQRRHQGRLSSPIEHWIGWSRQVRQGQRFLRRKRFVISHYLLVAGWRSTRHGQFPICSGVFCHNKTVGHHPKTAPTMKELICKVSRRASTSNDGNHTRRGSCDFRGTNDRFLSYAKIRAGGQCFLPCAFMKCGSSLKKWSDVRMPPKKLSRLMNSSGA